VKGLPLKIDLHVHTCYSYDATTTPNELAAYARKRGLDGVAITDHDTLKGAIQIARRLDSLLVIPGMEVSARGGHVLALNPATPIPKGLSLKETVQRIHEAGGIAIVAHPTSLPKVFPTRLRDAHLDAVEVINSRSIPFHLLTHLNRMIAVKFHLPQTGGSDAHHPWEVGLAYTLVEAEPKVGEVLQAIKRGDVRPFGRPIPWGMRVRRAAIGLQLRLRR